MSHSKWNLDNNNYIKTNSFIKVIEITFCNSYIDCYDPLHTTDAEQIF